MSKPIISLILPFYKQVSHVERIYKSYCECLDSLEITWEIIFVINGPDDGTKGLLYSICNRSNIKIESVPFSGWGRAVKYGISKSEGNYICYTNTARTDISDFTIIIKYALLTNDNLVKATRIIRANWIRKIGSTLYNLQFRLLFDYPIWDVNGTPKVFPSNLLNKFQLYSDDDLIDAEIIAKTAKYNIRIIEVPVRFTNRLSGKSTTNILSAIKMYLGLYQLRQKI